MRINERILRVVTKLPKCRNCKCGVNWSEVSCSEVKWNEGNEVKWTEMMILGELFVLSLIYNSVALCAVRIFPLLVASFCYFLINGHIYIFSTILFLICFASFFVFFYFVFSLFFVLLCALFLFMFRPFRIFTNLPSPATWLKPNCSKNTTT